MFPVGPNSSSGGGLSGGSPYDSDRVANNNVRKASPVDSRTPSKGRKCKSGMVGAPPSAKRHEADSHQECKPCMAAASSASCSQGIAISQRSVSSGDALTVDEALALPELQSNIRFYLSIGIYLGLPAGELLKLEAADLKENEECFRRTLTACGDRLTISALLKAVKRQYSSTDINSGYESLLLGWSEEQNLALDTPLSETQKKALIDYLICLPALQKDWEFLGLKLRVHPYEMNVIRADVEQGLSCWDRLNDVLKQVKSKTVKELQKVTSRYDCSISEKIERWAQSNGILDTSISQLNEEQLSELLSKLYGIAPEWAGYGLKLGIANCKLTEMHRLNTTKLSCEDKFFRVLELASDRGLLTKRKIVEAIRQNDEASGLELAQKWRLELEKEKEKEKECSDGIHWKTLLNDTYLNRDLTLSSVHSLFLPWQATEPVGVLIKSLGLSIDKMSNKDQFINYLLVASQNKMLHLSQVARWASRMPGYRLPEDVMSFMEEQQVETASKPVKAEDLFLLVADPSGNVSPDLTVLKVAALLGIPLKQENCLVWRSEISIANIWQAVLEALPFLQTGHLKQLFEEHDELKELANLLPVDEAPTVPLKAISYHAGNMAELAVLLKKNPDLLFLASEKLLTQGRLMQYLPFLQSYLRRLPPIYQLLILINNAPEVQKQFNAIADNYAIQASGELAYEDAMIIRSHGASSLIPDHFICPLSLQPMEEPVPVLMNGGASVRHFEKKWLLRALEEKQQNPLTREYLTPYKVECTPVNQRLMERIQEWLKEHGNDAR